MWSLFGSYLGCIGYCRSGSWNTFSRSIKISLCKYHFSAVVATTIGVRVPYGLQEMVPVMSGTRCQVSQIFQT